MPPDAPETSRINNALTILEKLPNANRNKRKGFFREMNNVRGVRTVFEDTGDSHITTPGSTLGDADGAVVDAGQSAGPSDSLPDGLPHHEPIIAVDDEAPSVDTSAIDQLEAIDAADGSNKRQKGSRRQKQFLLPSQLTELPSNIFITSVIFQRPRPDDAGNEEGDDGEPFVDVGIDEEIMYDPAVNGHLTAEESVIAPSNGNGTSDVDRLEQIFADVEAKYDTLPSINKTTPLHDITHGIVAWKVCLSSPVYSAFKVGYPQSQADTDSSGARTGHDDVQPSTPTQTRQSLESIRHVIDRTSHSAQTRHTA